MSDYNDIYYRASDGLTLYARDYAHAKPRATVLCLHGLTRNSADFAELCASLHDDYRIVAVDQRGRGHSDYDSNSANYDARIYVRDMFTLLDYLHLDRVIAIGTSMGGVISMAMAASAAHRFAGVVLNDIGPEIDPAGLERIRAYVGKLPPVASWDEAAAQVGAANASAFPDFGNDDWLRFARRLYREDESGQPLLAHDPAIADSLRDSNVPVNLWPAFGAMRDIPVLVIRGVLSDILAAACVAEMQRRRPDLIAVNVPNRGHAPMLDEPEAAHAIRRFIDDLSDG